MEVEVTVSGLCMLVPTNRISDPAIPPRTRKYEKVTALFLSGRSGSTTPHDADAHAHDERHLHKTTLAIESRCLRGAYSADSVHAVEQPAISAGDTHELLQVATWDVAGCTLQLFDSEPETLSGDVVLFDALPEQLATGTPHGPAAEDWKEYDWVAQPEKANVLASVRASALHGPVGTDHAVAARMIFNSGEVWARKPRAGVSTAKWKFGGLTQVFTEAAVVKSTWKTKYFLLRVSGRRNFELRLEGPSPLRVSVCSFPISVDTNDPIQQDTVTHFSHYYSVLEPTMSDPVPVKKSVAAIEPFLCLLASVDAKE